MCSSLRERVELVLLNMASELVMTFSVARAFAFNEVSEQLADFRSKRALGLGSLFGDHQLEGKGFPVMNRKHQNQSSS